MVRQVKDPEAGRTTSGASTSSSPSRPPLHEKRESQTNTLRIVPSTPPQFLSTSQSPTRDPIYGRTALPTSIHHLLSAPGKEQDLQGSALEDEVSKSPVPTTSNGSTSSLETPHQPQSSRYGTTATGSPVARPLPKKKLQVNLNPGGKTFNVSLASTSRRSTDDDGNASTKSPTPANSLSTKSSYDFLSSPDTQELQSKQSNSALSCTPDAFPPSSVAPANEQSGPSSEPISADPISSSPWNYRLVGGLRKVPKTPDLKQKAVGITDSPLPPLPETSDDPQQPAHDLASLASKPSFATTESDNTNYKVYQHSPSPSQTAEALPSSSDSNYRLIGEPSPTPSSVIHRPLTSDTNENYVVYGDPSAEPSPSTSFVNLVRPAEYSQESLIVPPLKPRAGKTNEGLGYYKSRSRESLRTGSLTSISTVLSQKEALRAIAASGSLINHPGRSNSNGSSSWASSSGNPYTQHMNEHPHQWSSQLSTIGSVSEEGTDRNSRQWSEGNGRRISSGFPSSNSRHSRQMLSISSSLAQEEERLSRSRSESLEPPQPAYARNGRSMSNPSLLLVGDQDEHGDGITDMQELRSRPSRSRLSGFFSGSSSNDGRTNTMRSTLSTASSRANSLVSSSLPAWAKIYYGSGERKFLMAPGGSISSGDDSRSNSFRSGSPSDHFPLSIYSPRRRPREENNAQQPREGRRRASLEITPIQPTYNGRRPFRTSSVWSPHLRTDLRTRHSVWDAPSINFSTESGIFGKRNSQVVLFIIGFIFPFAWMIAAFLPLPPDPMLSMRERDRSSANLDVSNDYALQFGPADEQRYESARWWRRLNRCMSVVGILIIAAIITLAVIGVRENW